MNRNSLFFRLAFAACLVTFFFAPVRETAAQQEYRSRKTAGRAATGARSLATEESSIFALVNRERARSNLSGLVWDAELAALARSYSQKMADESFFGHIDGDNRSVVERAENFGLRYWRKIGENLFFSQGYDRFDAVAVRGWMNSPSHRENILDRRFNASGIGVARAPGGKIYVTQIFMQK